jgi:5-oxoprolinase (ATP-hydrolysing)/N-methylhydantoinase A
VTLRKRDADGLPTLASVYPEGVAIEASGLFGGGAGRSACGLVRDASGAVIRDCGTGELVTLTSDREVVEVSLSGGSGFGDPRARPLAAVARDLAEGFITPEGAERDYSAVVGHDGNVDVAATEKRRRLGTAAE